MSAGGLNYLLSLLALGPAACFRNDQAQQARAPYIPPFYTIRDKVTWVSFGGGGTKNES